MPGKLLRSFRQQKNARPRPPPHDFHGHLIEAEDCLEEGGVHGKEKEGDEGRTGGFGGSP
jgi:hypothetical protein